MHSFAGVSPPQQLLVVTNGGSQLCGTDAASSYEAVNPVTINTLSRLMYWYNSTADSVMVQSLDGSEISVSCPLCLHGHNNAYLFCTCVHVRCTVKQLVRNSMICACLDITAHVHVHVQCPYM